MKKDNFKINFKKVWQYVKKKKGLLIINIFLNIIYCAVCIIIPLISAKIILNITSGLFDELLITAIMLFGIYIIEVIVSYFHGKLLQIISRETLVNIQSDLAKATLNLDIQIIDKNGSGMLLERINGDCNKITSLFFDISGMLSKIITLIGVFISILVINKYMFIYMIVNSIIIFIINKKMINKRFEIDKNKRKFSEKKTSLISELVRGIRDIKVLNISDSFEKMLDEQLITDNNYNYAMASVNRKLSYLTAFTQYLFSFLFIIFGIILCKNNLLELSGFLIIYNYRNRAFNSLSFITRINESLKDFNLSASRIFEIIDSKDFKKEKFGKKMIKNAEGHFKFENVNFSYNGEEKIIKDLSFSLSRGEKFLIVGKNGVGKSTLLKLIINQLQVDKGRIVIGNKTDIGYYAQEHELLEDDKTIMDNFSEYKLSNEKLRNHLGRFLFNNDEVFKKVKVLSPGEKSRVALAKLSLSGANFLILDEPTNHLDPTTQKIIAETFRDFKGTMLVVSHNPEFVDNLGIERVLELPKGKISFYDKDYVDYYSKLNENK